MLLLPHEIFRSIEIQKLVTRYNQWFIKLRYIAVVFLLFYILALKIFPSIELTGFQFYTMLCVMFLIFLYNIIIEHKLKVYGVDGGGYSLLFALLQIVLDIFSLAIIVYMSGGLEAPIFMFFVFHMIIGSVLLPKKIIYGIGISLISIFLLFSMLEYSLIIPHNKLEGLFSIELYRDINFVLGSLAVFGAMILCSIYLTKKIAMELYDRENELTRALTELSDAEINKQKYTMAVVHELKSPIAAASSFLDLLIGGYAGKVDDDAKDKIEKAQKRITESIENINNILRVSKFKVLNQLSVEKVNVIDIIKKIKGNLEPTISKKHITAILEIAQDVPEYITGDPVLLELAFSNIIGNAVKYTPSDGKVAILVSGVEKLAIRVIDDGIGIPKQDQERIFEDYFRAGNAKNSGIEGTGTGLSVVKNIVDSHKGSIKIISPSEFKKNNRAGTEFRIELPGNTLRK